MRYMIVAECPDGSLQYCGSEGFKANHLQAARFRTEEDARRRYKNCTHCRRMEVSGARIEFRRA